MTSLKGILLLSSSPRRRQILRMLNINFRAKSVKAEEVFLKDPFETALTNAENKLKLGIKYKKSGEVAIAADTVVFLGSEVLGKPKDEDDAFKMLLKLSGRYHTVVSAFAMSLLDGSVVSDFEVSKVKFKKLTRSEINWYIKSKEPMDKAGSYGVQGYGAFFIERIEGDFFNVMGLPIGRIYDILLASGLDLKGVVGKT